MQRVGVGPTGDILDIISSWSPEEQLQAHKAIEEIEEQALRDMQVGGVVHHGCLAVYCRFCIVVGASHAGPSRLQMVSVQQQHAARKFSGLSVARYAAMLQ